MKTWSTTKEQSFISQHMHESHTSTVTRPHTITGLQLRPGEKEVDLFGFVFARDCGKRSNVLPYYADENWPLCTAIIRPETWSLNTCSLHLDCLVR